VLVCAAFSSVASGAAGDLDPTFSGDGKQTTDMPLGSSRAAATAIQPDGKVVVVGRDFAHGGGSAVARYNPNGSPDTSFSGDGKLTNQFGDGAAVALQADGKIVVVGGSAISRYNPNGTLDPTFSGDGNQTIANIVTAGGVAIQDDGKIVVVGGTSGEGQSHDFAVARYNPNGSLDTSFSGDGKQTTDLGGADAAQAVALQDDGKIVAAGASGAGGQFALVRYNTNGSLDTSFSGDGKELNAFGFGGARGVALQSDGKIVVVGGTSGQIQARDFALVRYNTNGSLDTSFSGDGRQRTDIEDVDAATAVAVQGDGKIVAAGYADVLSVDHPDVAISGDFAVARYNTNGSLDTSFSGDGKQTTDFFGTHFDSAAGVALQGDGKIVAVGEADHGGGEDVGLARYSLDGSLDTTFSGDGKQTTFFGGIGEHANAVAIQDDGKIVAVGHSGPGATNGQGPPGDFGLARYNPDGSLDTSFSGDGRQTTDFGTSDEANAVAIPGDGKIVVVGQGGPLFAGTHFALARYNPDGSLDTSFSGDGMETTNFGAGTDDAATGVAIQDDGKIVVVGSSFPGFAVARYNPDGSLDTTFSGDGLQRTSDAGFQFALGVGVQANGKIVAVGVRYAGTFGDNDFALARYKPGGALDTSFSGDGLQTTSFGGNDRAAGVALQGDGKIVAVGQADGDGAKNLALARYSPNGSLDTTFSGDGKQTTDFGGVDGANSVALQPDGRIVAAGFAGATGSNFALARYSPNGSLDTTFSGDGKQTTNVGVVDSDSGSDGGAAGVALQGDGKIVLAGLGRGPSQTEDFALARYLGG
jgi:uncharacterized delta-60 repeat protein